MGKIVLIILVLALGVGSYLYFGAEPKEDEGTDIRDEAMMEGGDEHDDDDHEHEDGDDHSEDATKEDAMMEEKNDEAMMDDDSSDDEEPAQTSAFKNGTYSASADYNTPQGNVETVIIKSLTLENDVITAIDVEFEAEHAISKGMQEKFSVAYKPEVVGKKIDSVTLSRVGGASLTSGGFNDALTTIIDEAQG